MQGDRNAPSYYDIAIYTHCPGGSASTRGSLTTMSFGVTLARSETPMVTPCMRYFYKYKKTSKYNHNRLTLLGKERGQLDGELYNNKVEPIKTTKNYKYKKTDKQIQKAKNQMSKK